MYSNPYDRKKIASLRQKTLIPFLKGAGVIIACIVAAAALLEAIAWIMK